MYKLLFDTNRREVWIKNIVVFLEEVQKSDNDEVVLSFEGLTESQLHPEMIVLLACLIEYLATRGYSVHLDKSDVGYYLFNTLRFKDYWQGKKNFSASLTDNIFNLWRITEEEKENYGLAVKEYLNKHFFKDKDLAAVQNSITEACYNVLDHAHANGNGFSFIMYDEYSHLLRVAVCDFGIGVAESIRKAYPQIQSDREALAKSIETKVTVGSKPYNGGMGLDNIRSSCTENEYFTIISNGAFLISNTNKVRTADLDFYFNGTLLCFGINLSDYQDKEDVGSFSLDYL